MRRRPGGDAGDRGARALNKAGEAAAGAGRNVAGIVPFAAVSATYFAFAGLFSTWAPLWYASLGYTTFAIGALVALQSATRLFAPYAWGAWADASRRRERLLVLAAASAFVASLGFFVSPALGWVAFVTVVLYLATAGVVPINETLLSLHVSRDGQLDVGRYGRVRLWGSVGFIGAVAGTGFVLDALGVARFPILCAIVLALLVTACVRLPHVAEETPGVAIARGNALLVLRAPVVAWFFAGMFLTVLAHVALYAFLSLYLDSLGYRKTTIGIVWAVGVVAEVVWFAGQGRWLGRWPLHGWLVAAALASALRFGAIAAFASSLAVLVAAQLLHAFSFAAQHSACVALITRHFPGRLRGRGQALYAVLGYGASGVLGGLAGGALSESLGFAAVFWAAAAISLLAALACGRAYKLERRATAAAAPAPD